MKAFRIAVMIISAALVILIALFALYLLAGR